MCGCYSLVGKCLLGKQFASLQILNKPNKPNIICDSNIYYLSCASSPSVRCLADDARTTYISVGAPSFVAPQGSHCRDSASAAEYVNLSGTNTWAKIVAEAGSPASISVSGTLVSGSHTYVSPYITGSSNAFPVRTTGSNSGFLSTTVYSGSAIVTSSTNTDASVVKIIVQ